jgi:hypothetical protein
MSRAQVDRWAEPVFEAFIAGCWMLCWTPSTLFWVAKPRLHFEAVNERRRLHHPTSAAVEADSERLYFLHGVLVPAHVVLRPDWITADEIRDEPNAEVRRVMLDRFGTARYLEAIGAKSLHRDATGELFCAEMAGDEPLMMVRVQNSTPELDGSTKTYWLRVPPTIRTARGAVAWTFGMNEYQPSAET